MSRAADSRIPHLAALPPRDRVARNADEGGELRLREPERPANPENLPCVHHQIYT